MPPLEKKDQKKKKKNKKKKGKEAPLNLDYNIEELESDQQETDKSGKSFLIKRGVIMAGRHRIARNKTLELSGARIIKAMAARGRTSPQESIFNIK